MKDGEIWALEKKQKRRWQFVVAFTEKANAFCRMVYEDDEKSYRVVPYVRKEVK